jgi:3-oxoacyl-[acyl-carrier-protein] synthase II
MMSECGQKRRVVVTGMGAVSPLGLTMSDTWNGIIEGISKAAPVKKFDASSFATKIAYEVEDFQLNDNLLFPEDMRFLNLAAQYGINAGVEAMVQSGIFSAGLDPYRVGLCLGVGMFSPDYQWFDRIMLEQKYDDPAVRDHLRYWPNSLASVLGRITDARGGATTIHTACASSGQSLGEAFEQIAYGQLDVCLTGGADSMINPFHMAGFCLLGAMSKRNDDPRTASRPFDVDREGFVLGEGACMLVFEEFEHAKKRGAHILGEVCGYGVTESAYRITDLHPEGTGPKEAMEMAVADSGISPSEVGYVNAHGTSTDLNDRCESLAVSNIFPKDSVHMSSTKSMTGHLISAAGAMEFALCVKALEHQVLPPSINVFQKDPAIAVELTPSIPTDKKMNYALSNSVGFGGSNTALVAGRGPS